MMLGELHGLRLVEAIYYGEGTVVYAADAADGNRYALKRIVRSAGEDDRRLAQAEREHKVASLLRHPALRRSHARWRTPRFGSAREITLQLEYLEGPSLADERPESFEVACALLLPITHALAALHGAGLVHGDVKPGNILHHAGSSRLIDYGLCGPVHDRPPRIMGTPATMAPEQRARARRTPATDVFGIAATLQLIAMPPGELGGLLARALADRPTDRPGLAELADALAAGAPSRDVPRPF